MSVTARSFVIAVLVGCGDGDGDHTVKPSPTPGASAKPIASPTAITLAIDGPGTYVPETADVTLPPVPEWTTFFTGNDLDVACPRRASPDRGTRVRCLGGSRTGAACTVQGPESWFGNVSFDCAQHATAYLTTSERPMVPTTGTGLLAPVTLLATSPEAAPSASVGASALDQFQREGELWRLRFAGMTTLVRHGRGLALLGYLVRHPGVRIHVRELEAVTPRGTSSGAATGARGRPGSFTSGSDGAGPALDARAKRAYRRRLTELDGAIAAAETRDDPDGAVALQAEYALIAREMRAAVGLGGRDRPVASDVERMRVAITRRIRAAIRQIGASHPAFGAHLEVTVRTGFHCSYDVPAVEREA